MCFITNSDPFAGNSEELTTKSIFEVYNTLGTPKDQHPERLTVLRKINVFFRSGRVLERLTPKIIDQYFSKI